jgi:TetR/AcrR family transcriptional repressor of nem operon
MGVSKEKAADNRRAIIAAATRLFRERGVSGVGVTELMKSAGFTQGGFYNHFESKDDLVAAVLNAAMAEGKADLVQGAKAPLAGEASSYRRFVVHYLSLPHRDDVGSGCPIAGFATEVSRTGGEPQSSYARGFDDAVTVIAGVLAAEGAADGQRTLREQAIALYSQLVGALILARSVTETKPALSEEILEANRRALGRQD